MRSLSISHALVDRRSASSSSSRVCGTAGSDRPDTPVGPGTFALAPVAPGVVKRSLVFSVPNTPGSLYNALGPLATNGLNLTKIESRPARERPWDYHFYADVEGDPRDPRFESAIEELRAHCLFVNILGSYQVLHSAREDVAG